MKNMEKYKVNGKEKSPSKEKTGGTYEKQRFGTKGSEGNIYTNTYRDTSKSFIGIYKIFLRWKGSVYSLVWHDMAAFMAAYLILLLLYRVILVHFPVHKQHFELICIYANRFSSAIPITFLTGFYVSSVVSRWWDQFMSLPYPDQLALKLVAYVPGSSPFHKNLRRTVMRYVNLSSILAFTKIACKVQTRFPSYQSFVDAKLLLPHEVQRLQKVDDLTPHESSWTPLLWAMKLLTRARKEKKIEIEAPVFANLQSTFQYIETSNRKLLNYGWVNFPLAYTQVAHLAVFVYFGASLFSKQFLVPPPGQIDTENFPNVTLVDYSSKAPFDKHTPGLLFPFFTLVEMVCYLGWIKVAESLLNPFGDDDEDFNINYLIDRNLQVSYLIVDEADEDLEMAEDPFLEAGIPELPGYPTTPTSHISDRILKDDNIGIAISKVSELPLEIGQISINGIEEGLTKRNSGVLLA